MNSLNREWTTNTVTSVSGNPYRDKYDWVTAELLEWVWKAKTESDAVSNIHTILMENEKRKTFRWVFKQLLRKITNL